MRGDILHDAVAGEVSRRAASCQPCVPCPNRPATSHNQACHRRAPLAIMVGSARPGLCHVAAMDVHMLQRHAIPECAELCCVVLCGAMVSVQQGAESAGECLQCPCSANITMDNLRNLSCMTQTRGFPLSSPERGKAREPGPVPQVCPVAGTP